MEKINGDQENFGFGAQAGMNSDPLPSTHGTGNLSSSLRPRYSFDVWQRPLTRHMFPDSPKAPGLKTPSSADPADWRKSWPAALARR